MAETSSNLTLSASFPLIFQWFLDFGLKSYRNPTTIAPMSAKKSGWPISVSEGSVSVKIYRKTETKAVASTIQDS